MQNIVSSAPRIKATALVLIIIFSGFNAQSQYKYSATDRSKILQKRKELPKAMADYDKNRLYKSGLFFESMFDKYKDSSMATAIACYRIAASSESEYGEDWHSYKAAKRLAVIYETGKGVPADSELALIYYYLSDTSLVDTELALKEPSNNPSFQKVKQQYCNSVSQAQAGQGMNGMADSVVIHLSPFCRLPLAEARPVLKQFCEQLQKDPSKKIFARLAGQSRVPAAQYSLIAENYVMPQMFYSLHSYLVEELNISPERFILPVQRDYSYQGGYRLLLKIVQEDYDPLQ